MPAYQWLKDGSPLFGAAAATLLIDRVALTNAGNYAAVVRNSFGSATSAVAVLTVNAPAAITAQPEDQSVIAGSDVKLRAEVTGSSPLRIQWFKNKVAVTGATSNVLALAKVQATNAALYYLIASNSFGAATSRTAQLTINFPPTFLSHPANQLASPGAEVRFDVAVEGTPPFIYQWFKDDQLLINGVERALTLRQVQLSDSGRYKVHVKNLFGTAESTEAALVVQSPPAITRQPSSQTVPAGADVMLLVEFIGRSPLTIQWFKDGIPIPGANSASLLLNPVTAATAGHYKVSVQNSDGKAESSEAVIVVESPIASRADFDADGRPDLLFQNDEGFVASWLMSGTVLQTAEFLIPDRVSTDWRIAATGDFNRDRLEDIVFQNVDGTVAVWFMNGRNRVDGQRIDLPLSVRSEWRLAGAADFNQDAHIDLLFQHVTGTVAIWFFNRTEVTRNEIVSLSPGDSHWNVVGADDFDREGHNDIVFQHTDGTLAIWYMRGAAVVSAEFISPSNPGDRKWRVVNVIDRNGTGTPDLLFQHETERTTAVWLMNGRNLVEARLLNPPVPGGSWHVVGQ